MEVNKLVDDILFPSETLQMCLVEKNEFVLITNFRLLCIVSDQWVLLYRRMLKTFDINFQLKQLFIKRYDLLEMRIQFKNDILLQEIIDCLRRTQPECGKVAFSVYAKTPKDYKGPLKTRNQWMRDSLGISEEQPDIMKFEIDRLGFDIKSGEKWRITSANKDFELTPTYPTTLLVPASISDENLALMANFRTKMRLPSVVWRCPWNEAVVIRCSQPRYGIVGRRCPEDEEYISKISEMSKIENSDVGGIRIVDCRSYGGAEINRARGGGREYDNFYKIHPVFFLGIPNIHVVRSQARKMRTDAKRYVSHERDLTHVPSLEGTRWLETISEIMSGVNQCVLEILDFSRSLLVHCSDGWDRTAQISSLVQIQMDPYYRSIIGFQVLVEKEWILHGHCFDTRCSTEYTPGEAHPERSPIFLQWIECVYQLMMQFPECFEFNEEFLIRLVQHVYSSFFGDFLADSARERHLTEINEKTFCIWSYLTPNDSSLVNPDYVPQIVSQKNVILSNQKYLNFWKRLYFDSSRSLNISSRSPGTEVRLPFELPESSVDYKFSNIEDFHLYMDFDGLASFSFTQIEPSLGFSNFSAKSFDSLDSANDLNSCNFSQNVTMKTICHVCTRPFESIAGHCCRCGLCICRKCVGNRGIANLFSWDYKLLCINCR